MLCFWLPARLKKYWQSILWKAQCVFNSCTRYQGCWQASEYDYCWIHKDMRLFYLSNWSDSLLAHGATVQSALKKPLSLSRDIFPLRNWLFGIFFVLVLRNSLLGGFSIVSISVMVAVRLVVHFWSDDLTVSVLRRTISLIFFWVSLD